MTRCARFGRAMDRKNNATCSKRVMRLNECGEHTHAVKLASELIDSNSSFAEAYHQRSLALFHLDEISDSIEDCRRVLH